MTIFKRFVILMLFAVSGSLLFFSPAYGLTGDCRKAVDVYNRACDVQDLEEEKLLLNQALSFGCSDAKILAKIHNNFADCLEKQGLLKEAEAEYRQAIQADPFLATPYLSLGDIYAKLNMKGKAENFYEKGFLLRNYRSPEDIILSLSPTRSIKVVPSDTLYFGFDQAVLSDVAKRQLQALADALGSEELLACRFLLEGHTCSKGSEEYNQSLSERRAEAVLKGLTDRGITRDRLTAKGFGESRPIADNSNEQGRRRNRRVEIRTVGMATWGIQRGSHGPAHSRALDLLHKGESYLAGEEYQPALGKFLEALDLFRQENDPQGIQAARMDLGLTYRYLGNWEKAKALLEAAEGDAGGDYGETR